MNKSLLLNSNGIVFDRKYIALMTKFKGAMVKEVQTPSREQVEYENHKKQKGLGKDPNALNNKLNNIIFDLKEE